MSKLDDVIRAVRELTSEEILYLRSEIERVDKARRLRIFDLSGFRVELMRLHDEEYVRLVRRSIAIEDNWHARIRSYLNDYVGHSRLNLAQLFYTLERTYGKTGECYDDYKGTFSFPFAISIIKPSGTWEYLLEIQDLRGTCEFSVRKVIETENRDYVIRPPFANEFSRDEIDYFINYFEGYLIGRFEAYVEHKEQVTPFLRTVQSNLILYGYHNGQFFVNDYDSEEKFNRAITVFALHPEV